MELSDCADHCLARINAIQSDLPQRIDEKRLSLRGSELYLAFLQFVREPIDRYTAIAFLQRELDKGATSRTTPPET
ncbi:hypothetical protein [uncultured Desulfovibrio sp.]|uniref:hypothetical protein n=1 Tax=uncultured Desulfovibrio sp. TaxID=167968 RepID=UPI0003A11FE5|nr:hypothetical protein [uncultured Desulfovibrio sp.]